MGTDTAAIVENVRILLDGEAAYRKMAQAMNPYGDGKAVGRVVEGIDK